MDGQAQDYGFDYDKSVFKPYLQGNGKKSKDGEEEGRIKVHKIINANEGVSYNTKFTSAATHDSFMLSPEKFDSGDILAIDRAYIDIKKFQELTKRGIVYVTKMKKNLTYELVEDKNFMN